AELRAHRKQVKRDVKFRFFPAAFTHTIGQIQADGPIRPLARKVEAINRDVRARPGVGPPVACSRNQIYNDLSHHTRLSAGQHIAQRGILTGTAAGAYAHTWQSESIASKSYGQVSSILPHSALATQIRNVKKSYLRFENVFTIHINRLDPSLHNGRAFFDHVVEPVLSACSHSDVCAAIKQSTVVLRHDVFPKLYIWTSTPITILMEEIWLRYVRPVMEKRRAAGVRQAPSSRSRSTPSIARLGMVPEPQWIEILAILERSFNFCHTGNAICLSQKLMQQTFTNRALLDGYMPLLAGALKLNSADGAIPIAPLDLWPTTEDGQPLVASKTSQVYTYGESHWSRYYAQFRIKHRIAVATATIHDSEERMDLAISVLGDIVVQAYQEDVVEMVRRAVKAVRDDAKLRPNDYAPGWVETRRTSFRQWHKRKNPLDYGDDYDTISLLSRAIAIRDDARIDPLPQAPEKSISVMEFAHRLYNIGTAQRRQSVVAPVWREGATWHTLHVTLAHGSALLGQEFSDAEKAKRLTKAIADAVLANHVHFFPNKSGDRSSVPSLSSWTYLGNPPNAAHLATSRLDSVGTHLKRKRTQAIRELVENDITAKWNILECTIESYKRYMTRTRLPEDWSWNGDQSLEGNEEVYRVYQWAATRLANPQRDWCTRLAMHLAFLLSKITPYVFSPDVTKENDFPDVKRILKEMEQLKQNSPSESSISIIRKLPWIKKERNGAHDRALYFTQAAVVIMSWIDPDSPVRKQIENVNRKRELIAQWNKKHGLGCVTMIKLGVLYGAGRGVLSSPKTGQNYFARSVDDLMQWEQQVTGALGRSVDGAYKLVLTVFGTAIANRLIESGEMPSISLPRNAPSTSRLGSALQAGRRTSTAIDDSDNEGGHPPQRRRY
ncbi:hypothetical protein BD311DRAFT_679245, partial [Dichomitus squalens]